MIVKIMDVDAKRWVWIDRVAQCTTVKAFLKQDPTKKEIVGLYLKDGDCTDTICADESFIPHHVFDQVGDGETKAARVSIMCLTMRGMGNVRRIAYYSQVFLINDEGKTIERL